jgi:hypothetical protein
VGPAGGLTVADTAADQLRRILALIPELADDEAHPIEPLAAQLQVSRETLLADLRALTERFDDPAGFIDEGISLFIEHDRIALTSPHFRRPMRLTSGELHALDLGLAVLEAERPPEEHRAIDRARGRLRAVMARLPGPEAGDVHRHAVLAAGGDPEHLRALREAMRRASSSGSRTGGAARTRHRARALPLRAGRGQRHVVPRRPLRGERRRPGFRLDRVEAAEVLGAPYTVPPSFSLDAVVRDGRVFSGPWSGR